MRRALTWFLVLTIVELILLYEITLAIGGWVTAGWLLGSATIGILAGRAQGLSVLRRWLDATADGERPEEGLVDGLLVLLGALLLIVPGALGDVVGLLLLLPPVRRRLADRIRLRAAGWVQAGSVQVFSPRVEREDPPFENDDRPVIDVEAEVVEERPERLLRLDSRSGLRCRGTGGESEAAAVVGIRGVGRKIVGGGSAIRMWLRKKDATAETAGREDPGAVTTR